MPERPIGAVSKTVVVLWATVGSNPTLSASWGAVRALFNFSGMPQVIAFLLDWADCPPKIPRSPCYNLTMPILDPHTFEFFSRSAEQTRRLGGRLGMLLSVGDLVCLSGDLGSGKTTLVQGMAQGWGSLDPVSSPTFILVNEYRRADSACLFHLDAYRLTHVEEAEELDFERMLECGALVVEWPEHIQAALPAECLWISLRYVEEEQRHLLFQSRGERYDSLLNEFRQKVVRV